GSDRGSHTGIRPGHDVAGCKHTAARGLQASVHHDGPRAIEVELAAEEIGLRHAGDLHDEASGGHAPLLTVSVPDEYDGLEALTAFQRSELPSREVLDSRFVADSLDAALPRGAFPPA